jgi:hypothetical protein
VQQNNINLSGEKAEEIKGEEPENGGAKLDFRNQQTRDLVDEICEEQEKKVELIEDELDPDSHPDYQQVFELTLDDMTIQWFYNNIYGPKRHEDIPDKYFWHTYLEENKNYDIEVTTGWDQNDPDTEIPDYYKDMNKTVEDFSPEELKESFSQIKSAKVTFKYVHPLNNAIGPSKCDVIETVTTYFISPMKFIWRAFVVNMGFTYWDYFNPMGISIVEQKYDKKKNRFSVNLRYFFRVNFVKSVMFFQNKIKTEAINETTKWFKDFIGPMITQYLERHQSKFKRPLPKLKKKMTKADRLRMQIEDMEIAHEEELQVLRKDYESQISVLNQEIQQVREQNDQLAKRLYIAIVCFLLLAILLKSFS